MAAAEQKESKIGTVDVNDADEQTTQDLTEFVQSLLHKMVCKFIPFININLKSFGSL